MLVQEDPSTLFNKNIDVEDINRTYELFQSEVTDLTNINTPLPWNTGWCFDHAKKKKKHYSFQDAGKLKFIIVHIINNN